MSAKWMGYFFDESDLDGSELLLALAIADHADMEGKCFPGISLLAKKIRVSERQTQTLIRRLEEKGYVKVLRSTGRGHLTRFTLQRVKSTTPFSEKGRSLAQIKGEVQRQERVKSSVLPIYKDEPSYEPNIEERETHTHFAVTAYEKAFPNSKLPLISQQVVEVEITDAVIWDETLRLWATNGYSARNVTGLIERFKALLAKKKPLAPPIKLGWTPPDYSHLPPIGGAK